MPDIELSHEEPLNSVTSSTGILIRDIKVALPSEPESIDANARTEITQDAGIKEHTLDTVVDAIFIAEETLPSKLDGLEDVLKFAPVSIDVTIPEKEKSDVSEQDIDDAIKGGAALKEKAEETAVETSQKYEEERAVTKIQTDEKIDLVEERKVENYVKTTQQK